jgi:hypothetical protein
MDLCTIYIVEGKDIDPKSGARNERPESTYQFSIGSQEPFDPKVATVCKARQDRHVADSKEQFIIQSRAASAQK